MKSNHSELASDKNSNAEASSTNTKPKAPKRAKKPHSDSPIKHSEKEEPYSLKMIRKWIVVIFTGGMFLYNVFLFNQTKQQSFDASAKADSSFALSKKIADSQERFARIDTRAYIALTKIETFKLNPNGFDADIIFYNAGRSPANNVRFQLGIKTYNGKGVWKKDFDSLEKKIKPATQESYTIGPLSSQTINYPSLNFKITKSDSAKIYRKELNCFVYGTVVYTDIFNVTDTTRFCFQFIPPNSFIGNSIYNQIK